MTPFCAHAKLPQKIAMPIIGGIVGRLRREEPGLDRARP